MRVVPALIALLAAAPVAAQQSTPPRPAALYGHLAYAEAAEGGLIAASDGFALGQRCVVQPAMMPDLTRMLAAASAAGVGLRGLSCYRSYRHQQSAFCRRGCTDAERRARLVGPPGYSEHATGYAIDFGERPARSCADVSPCFAATAAGRWLSENAAAYGFELSFPPDNAQGVSWEPWHWRWVGADAHLTGAGAARTLFARARIAYPARPAVPPLLAHIAEQPPLPVAATAAPAARR